MSERKRLIKAARQIAVERVLEVLRRDDDMIDDHFLVYHQEVEQWSIQCWSKTNGMMSMTICDDALALACVEYMRNHGYLCFESPAEVSEFIRSRGWVCSRSRPGKDA